jgi:phenylalanyl-tRNA synthetase beta subunit
MLEIFYESDNHTCITPEVTERVLPVEVNYINKILGVDLKPEDQVKLLFKMGIESVADNQILNVTIPFSRNDIL